MRLLQKKVRTKIKDMLPATFGLLLDGWTIDAYHFSGIFAAYSKETTTTAPQLVQVLLSCNVADDFDDDTQFDDDLHEDEKFYGFTAADWFDVIADVLNLEYGRNITADNAKETIEFMTGDNCSTNRKLCNDLGKIFHCYYFHILILHA
jgi:hypothetical protein